MHRRPRRLWLAPLVVALGLVATGCDSGLDSLAGDDGGTSPEPITLVVSDVWVADHQGDGGAGGASGATQVAARISALKQAIDRLRDETGTGWVGRQDDVTGYLAELSGGSWGGAAPAFLDEYGVDLFGVDTAALRLGEPDDRTVPGTTSTRATQAIGDVPVHDARLTLLERNGRVSGAHGRVYPGLTVSTVPVLNAKKARRAAEQASGGTAQSPPSLVVLPRGLGVLAWRVSVAAVAETSPLTGADYFIDAANGDVVGVEATSGEGRLLFPTSPGNALRRGSHGRSDGLSARLTVRSSVTTPAAADPRDVEISGPNPIGGTLTGHGIQTDKGVALVDTTTPWWDPATGTGAIETYDATGLQSASQLPGKRATSKTTTVRDAETMAAHALSRDVLDYYASLGRSSWDGAGGSLFSSVHYGPSDFCNSFFTTSTSPPQMVYGNPCTVSSGQLETTEVEIDTAGHEITHGVTDTSAGLKYTGQSGALNEGFSDYFGNVIGNRLKGTDDAAVFEGSCTGISKETPLCTKNPDGSLSLRYMLNGNDFDDYLRVLDPGFRLVFLGYDGQDHGGVHYNSAIWNNALWSIRTNLAKIDSESGNDSPLAQAFDRAVYGALTTRLGPTSGFLDARAAIEQVIVDSSLDPTVLRVARETFDANKICSGCPDTGELGGDPVSTSPSTQLHPVVSGSSVAWLDVSGGTDYFGYLASTKLGGASPSLGSRSDVVDVAFAGDALLTFDLNGRVIRYAADGTPSTLTTIGGFENAVAAGLAGSDSGGAWSDGSSVFYVDPAGQVTSAALPGLRGDNVTGLGAGDGIVGAGTDGGKVFVWTAGGQPQQVGQLDGAVLSVAAYGGNVVAVDDDGVVALFTADGQSFQLSGRAAPFGVTMNDKYVVWSEVQGALEAGVAGGVSNYPDTNLYLASLASGKIYDLVPTGGQQGFPSLSGNRLVWQDAAFGGDDVLTAEVPDDL